MDMLVKIPVAIRAGEETIEYLLSLTTQKPLAFQDETTGEERLGTVDEYGRVYIKKDAVDLILKERGVIVKDFMKWARMNEFVRCDNTHYSVAKRLRGENKVFRCVCISARIAKQEIKPDEKPTEA